MIPNNDGIVGRNDFDSTFIILDAYRRAIEENIPELKDRVLVDYPNSNIEKMTSPPKLVIMDSYSVVRHKMGGVYKIKQTLNDDGETWTRISRVGFNRLIIQMDLWAKNATERGKIHAALMGLTQPIWIMEVDDVVVGTMMLQHWRPIRESREDEVCRMIYTGYILCPELVREKLYKVKDVIIRLAFLNKKQTAPEIQPYSPNIHFEVLPDVDG